MPEASDLFDLVIQNEPMTPGGEKTAGNLAGSDTLDFVRNLYDTQVNWFRSAESKAQLVLTVNGVFMSVLVGSSFGALDRIRSLINNFGPETWALLLVSVLAFTGAIGCAVRSLWSWHRRRTAADFARLEVDPMVPSSYSPEILWYFGGLSRLPIDRAVERLRQCGSDVETTALAYNAVILSRSLVRKFRLLNASWALTALSLICFVAAAGSAIFRG